MPNYRRWRLEGGTYFFTLVTYDRRPIFGDPAAVALLRAAVAAERATRPFEIEAAVVLPDHAHFLWSLPKDDTDYSSRIGRIKASFTKALRASPLAEATAIGPGRQRGYSTVWQPRFWEHAIRDQEDFNRHVEYVHYNPVRHGHARCPHLWPASSFHEWVRKGWQPAGWSCYCDGRPVTLPNFDDIAASAGE